MEQFLSYEEFKNLHKYDCSDECFVNTCHNKAEYKEYDGQIPYVYCEKHSHIKYRYDCYVRQYNKYLKQYQLTEKLKLKVEECLNGNK